MNQIKLQIIEDIESLSPDDALKTLNKLTGLAWSSMPESLTKKEASNKTENSQVVIYLAERH